MNLAQFFKKPAAVAAAAGTALLSAGSANATILSDAQTAIAGAAGDALTVGGYVVAGIASLLVVGLIISMMRKL